VDVTYVPSSLFTSVYLNSDLVSNVGANGSGSLSTSASLLLLNNTTSSNSGTVGNLYNFKVYNPLINSSNIRKNYNSMCSRFGLPLALYIPPAPLLLDLYPGAAAAYSLRKLSENYFGFSIQVRRSSDNAVLDIGFTSNGDLDTSALLAHCSSGNGFVTTWYDQSGNGYNATQGNALSQPQIVNSGTVVFENGQPTLDFSVAKILATGLFASAISQPNTYFITVNKANHGGYLFEQSGGGARQAQGDDTWVFAGSVASGFYPNAYLNSQQIFTALFNGSNSISRMNGVSVGSGDPGTNGQGGLQLGRGSNSFNIQEFIIFQGNQTNNFNGIETNINSYYSIY
jgi:hypothetical protein